MKIQSRILICLILPVLFFAATGCTSTRPATDVAKNQSRSSEPGSDIWNDPVFKQQFIASYGIHSEIEPRVTPEEVAILEKIRPMMAEDLPKAESSLRRQIKPESSAILDFTLGGIYFQQNNMVDALAQYLKAITKFPNFRRAWRNIGLIHVRNGKFDEAIHAFTRMIELGGGDAYSYGLLGFAYASKQDYQAAEAAYRNALLLQPDNAEWRLGVTRCAFKQQKFTDAATLLEVLLSRYPEKADFWLLQAQTYLGMKQPLKAAENLEAVAQLGKATADSQYTLGDIYLSENLMDLSGAAYLKAMDLDITQSSRALRSAEMLAGRGALTQARQVAGHIRDVLGKQMNEAEQRKLLKLEARLSMAEGGNSSETANVLEEIIRLDPLDGEALLLLGQHYAKQNQPDRAILYYERAEGIDAFEANAKIRHAQILVGMKRYAEAVPQLRRALEIKPNEDVAAYLKQIERMAKTQ